MKAKIITLSGGKGSDVDLSDALFGLPLRKDILHRVVEWQRAKKQAGTHKTKLIHEISGTTAKPFNQKGTGNARQGSRRAPHMRGGSTMFGPRPRSHAYKLPKKIRTLGLKTALSQKAQEGKLRVIDTLVTKAVKTKEIAATLKKLGVNSALFVRGDSSGDDFTKSVQNIPHMDLIPEGGLNVYDILRHDELVITTHALKALEERLV